MMNVLTAVDQRPAVHGDDVADQVTLGVQVSGAVIVDNGAIIKLGLVVKDLLRGRVQVPGLGVVVGHQVRVNVARDVDVASQKQLGLGTQIQSLGRNLSMKTLTDYAFKLSLSLSH